MFDAQANQIHGNSQPNNLKICTIVFSNPKSPERDIKPKYKRVNITTAIKIREAIKHTCQNLMESRAFSFASSYAAVKPAAVAPGRRDSICLYSFSVSLFTSAVCFFIRDFSAVT